MTVVTRAWWQKSRGLKHRLGSNRQPPFLEHAFAKRRCDNGIFFPVELLQLAGDAILARVEGECARLDLVLAYKMCDKVEPFSIPGQDSSPHLVLLIGS